MAQPKPANVVPSSADVEINSVEYKQVMAARKAMH
jgi:hypothetical protein